MKKIYETPLFEEVDSKEFFYFISRDFGVKRSCYSCKGCK